MSSIEERIYEGMMKQEKRAEGIHVTSLTSKCLRRSAYDRNDPTQSMDMESTIRVWLGRTVHSIQLLNGMFEEPFRYPPDICCSIDEWDKGTLLEKKTITFPLDSVSSLVRYYSNYIEQVEYYKSILEFNKVEVKEVAILLVNIAGNNGDRKVSIHTFSTESKTKEKKLLLRDEKIVKDEIEERASVLRKCNVLDPKSLPLRKIGSHCNYCIRFSKCFNGDGVW